MFKTYGRLRVVDNIDRRFGAEPSYLFLKVRSGPAEWQEEHWLVTEHEAKVYQGRGLSYPRVFEEKPGKLTEVDAKYGSVGVRVVGGAGVVLWILTPADVERLRQRAEANAEDIVANREGWLADLLD